MYEHLALLAPECETFSYTETSGAHLSLVFVVSVHSGDANALASEAELWGWGAWLTPHVSGVYVAFFGAYKCFLQLTQMRTIRHSVKCPSCSLIISHRPW